MEFNYDKQVTTQDGRILDKNILYEDQLKYEQLVHVPILENKEPDFQQCWVPFNEESEHVWLRSIHGRRKLVTAGVILYTPEEYRGRGTKVLKLCPTPGCCNPMHNIQISARSIVGEYLDNIMIANDAEWETLRYYIRFHIENGIDADTAVSLSVEKFAEHYGQAISKVNLGNYLQARGLLTWFHNLGTDKRNSLIVVCNEVCAHSPKPVSTTLNSLLLGILEAWNYRAEKARILKYAQVTEDIQDNI